MLTGNLVRVRYSRNRIVPNYIDPGEARWQMAVEQLLELLRGQEGRTRGELEEDVAEAFGGDPGTLVHRGLAKLLEDRCEFEVVSGQPPEKIREIVFRLAARERLAAGAHHPVLDSQDVEAHPHSLGLSTTSQREATLRL